MNKKHQINFRCDADMAKTLKDMGRKTGMGIAGVIEYCVARYGGLISKDVTKHKAAMLERIAVAMAAELAAEKASQKPSAKSKLSSETSDLADQISHEVLDDVASAKPRRRSKKAAKIE